jgi:hypothetical protein
MWSMGQKSYLSGWSGFRRQWWVIIVLMILGAFAGLGLHQLRPQIYRASATLIVGVDFVRTAVISETEVIHIIGLVGDQVNSKTVAEEIIQRAQAEGIEIDAAGLNAAGQAIRQSHVWLIEIRHPDPETAARLANLWVETAYAQLDSLMVYSVLADNYAATISAMQSCYEMIPALPPHAYCNPDNLETIQSQLLELTYQLENARLASGQIPSTASVVIGRKALPPLSPEESYRNIYLFAGALLGLGAALVLLSRPQ